MIHYESRIKTTSFSPARHAASLSIRDRFIGMERFLSDLIFATDHDKMVENHKL
jgi:hypothetical protein